MEQALATMSEKHGYRAIPLTLRRSPDAVIEGKDEHKILADFLAGRVGVRVLGSIEGNAR